MKNQSLSQMRNRVRLIGYEFFIYHRGKTYLYNPQNKLANNYSRLMIFNLKSSCKHHGLTEKQALIEVYRQFKKDNNLK